MARRQVAADVPEFLEVLVRRALGRLDAEGGVAALAAAALDEVPPLDLFGQGEEGLGARDGAVDQVRRQVVVGHHGEAIAGERCAQLLREPLEIAVVELERDRLDAGQIVGGGVHGGWLLAETLI